MANERKMWKAGCLLLSLVLGSLVCAFGFLIARAVSVAPRWASLEQTGTTPAESYSLSAEQQSLVNQLGYPDVFTLQFYQEGDELQDVRLEIWSYFQVGQEVTFLNGQVIDRLEIDVIPGLNGPPPYRPEQFNQNMDRKTALLPLRTGEAIFAPLDTEGIGGGELVFADQIALGFQDGNLLYVECFPEEGMVQP